MASEMELTNTLAGRRVAWILNRAGDAVNASEVEEHFAPSFLQHINADQVIGFVAQMGQLKGGVVDRINEESDREIGVVMVIEGQTVRISAKVEPEPPHRLTSFGIRTGPTLLEAIDSAEPTAAPLAEVLEAANETEDGELIAGGVVTGAMRGDEEAVSAFGDVSDNQIFEIGSITKPFTGILLAEMAERGDVALDAPIARYLPSGIRVPSQNGREITLVDLATHSSGLPRLPSVMRASDPQNPYAEFSVDDLHASLEQAGLEFPIGSRSNYSNFGFGLLGHVLAVAADTSFGDLIRSRICEPLGLAETFVKAPESLRARRAQGHDQSGSPTSHWDPGAIAGAGGVESTVRDMLRFIRANTAADAGTALGRALLRAREPRLQAGAREHVGLGWHMFETSDGTSIVWHNGGTGGFRSTCAFHVPSSTGVVALTNWTAIDPDPEVLRLVASLAKS